MATSKTNSPAPDDKPAEALAGKPLPSRWLVLKAPGVKACGPYKPGIAYEVEGREAERLMAVKGFVAATDEEITAAKQAAADK